MLPSTGAHRVRSRCPGPIPTRCPTCRRARRHWAASYPPDACCRCCWRRTRRSIPERFLCRPGVSAIGRVFPLGFCWQPHTNPLAIFGCFWPADAVRGKIGTVVEGRVGVHDAKVGGLRHFRPPDPEATPTVINAKTTDRVFSIQLRPASVLNTPAAARSATAPGSTSHRVSIPRKYIRDAGAQCAVPYRGRAPARSPGLWS
jgi:hypothetical protein